MTSRSSLESFLDRDNHLPAARDLQDRIEKLNLQLVNNISAFNSSKFDSDSEDGDEIERKDPAVVANDVAAQISFLRKLKFQYLEQNAKDRYVKSIVSDIDDAPIKLRLKVAKGKLAEAQGKIRNLAPNVETDFLEVKAASERATDLAQKIIDARLALSRLRAAHPHPRLTIPLADQKLKDQVEEMHALNDTLEAVKRKVSEVKDRAKNGAGEMESLRVEKAEVEKKVREQRAEGGEEDRRLGPLYDWFTSSLALHHSLSGLHSSESVSENELHLVYNLSPSPSPTPKDLVTITLIFAPDTRALADARVEGLGEDEVGDVLGAHVQVGDARGLIAAVLAIARNKRRDVWK
ncbi:hypothetical protein BDQ17DRAFT_1421510 [Cyathus striatus]|nr:hypothetical protein BDQ17DRAFT_1421510 [Cyathus striatus]